MDYTDHYIYWWVTSFWHSVLAHRPPCSFSHRLDSPPDEECGWWGTDTDQRKSIFLFESKPSESARAASTTPIHAPSCSPSDWFGLDFQLSEQFYQSMDDSFACAEEERNFTLHVLTAFTQGEGRWEIAGVEPTPVSTTQPCCSSYMLLGTWIAFVSTANKE